MRSRSKRQRQRERARRDPAGAERPAGRSRDALVALAIAAATFLAYLPSLSLPFLDWDDPQYISENPYVQRA
jgi:hypothetical protein